MSVRVSGQDEIIRATLRGTLLFAKWPPAQFDKVCEAAELWRYSKGEAIAVRADPAKGLWAVASGAVLSDRSWPNGAYMIMGVNYPGAMLGVVSVFDGSPMPISAHAKVETLVVFVPRDAILAIVRNDNERLLEIMDFLCDRLRVQYESMQMRARESLRCQIAKHLAFMSRGMLLNLTTAQWAQFALTAVDITQDEIAAMLFVSRQTVNRVMTSLVREGVIARKQHKIRIVDFERLLSVMEEVEPLPDNWRAEILGWDAKNVAAQDKIGSAK